MHDICKKHKFMGKWFLNNFHYQIVDGKFDIISSRVTTLKDFVMYFEGILNNNLLFLLGAKFLCKPIRTRAQGNLHHITLFGMKRKALL